MTVVKQIKRDFTPLVFQGSLAAAGVALMPYIFLQFGIPHGDGPIRIFDIGQGTLQPLLLYPLYVIMVLFTALHFLLTFANLKSILVWILNKGTLHQFLSKHGVNIGIFSPIISLSMSINVIFGPVLFFAPTRDFGANWLITPSFVLLLFLFIAALSFEAVIAKTLFRRGFDISKLNFGWMLDSFAFGMLALAGSGISIATHPHFIAPIAAIISWASFAMGLLLLLGKVPVLVFVNLKADSLPEKASLPAILILIPIICLLGVSLFKLNTYLTKAFSFDLSAISYLAIMIGFVVSGMYMFYALYWLKQYFSTHFIKDDFYASQWAIVCAFVGLQVLSVHVHGNYYQLRWLAVANYLSIAIAAIIYFMVFAKWLQFQRVDMAKVGTSNARSS